MSLSCELVLWAVGLYILYKAVEWLIHFPWIERPELKYIMITGCDSGFGHEIAKRLDMRQVFVIAACLTEKGETELRKVTGHRIKIIHMNVADTGSVAKAYEEVKNHIPEGKGLWGLVNNAGIAGRVGPSEWLTMKDYQDVIDVNLLGLINVTNTFLPLIKQTKGRIVNTASVFGRFAIPGSPPYVISKYGVEAFSDGLRRNMRLFGVKVSIIEPGFHKTNIVNLENIKKSLYSAFEQSPKHVQDEYGREFVDASVKIVLEQFISGVISENIQDVVDGYETALLARIPRARYVIGKDAKLLWLPIQWMPEWLGDFILEKLNKNRPIPAALEQK